MSKRRRWIGGAAAATVVIAAAAAAWWWPALRPGIFPVKTAAQQPDPGEYTRLKTALETRRADLAVRLRAAPAPRREAILAEARRELESTLPRMMRCWLGTRWDFNGTTETPGQGRIACGYFVATILRDAGFRVERSRLARQASGNILRSFVPKSACRLMVGQPYEAFVADVLKRGPGIYIVGLDTHVGFLVREDGGFRFIHSSGARPWCVVDESPAGADVLQASRWREYANLTAGEPVILAWLQGRNIAVVGSE